VPATDIAVVVVKSVVAASVSVSLVTIVATVVSVAEDTGRVVVVDAKSVVDATEAKTSQ
jgi:mRNA degradation ribonuclease J1/J2